LKKSEVDKIRLLLNRRQFVVIITHINPDGDAIGSALALMHYLKLKGHNVTVIVPSKYPGFLAWMPGIEAVKVFGDDKGSLGSEIERADVIFCLDFNTVDRMDEIQYVFEKSQCFKGAD
jgi:bifunctional oligoribonuclease and PAP phosphatase NrnA